MPCYMDTPSHDKIVANDLAFARYNIIRTIKAINQIIMKLKPIEIQEAEKITEKLNSAYSLLQELMCLIGGFVEKQDFDEESLITYLVHLRYDLYIHQNDPHGDPDVISRAKSEILRLAEHNKQKMGEE